MRGDLVPSSWGNEDGIARVHGLLFAVYFHDALAFKNEVKLLAQFVVVPFCGSAYGHSSLCKGLVLHGGIRAVQNAADGAAVFGGKWFLGRKGVDGHADACMVRLCTLCASLPHEL